MVQFRFSVSLIILLAGVRGCVHNFKPRAFRFKVSGSPHRYRTLVDYQSCCSTISSNYYSCSRSHGRQNYSK